VLDMRTTEESQQGIVALKVFAKITARWGLTREQQRTVLATSESTLRRWLRDPSSAAPNRDQLERISYVMGVFDGLHRMLGDTEYADAWVESPNPHFGERAPLARMLDGNVADLAFVRAYVDHWADGY
jgi:hypothetical protein